MHLDATGVITRIHAEFVQFGVDIGESWNGSSCHE
jgi:hypothetical protein